MSNQTLGPVLVVTDDPETAGLRLRLMVEAEGHEAQVAPAGDPARLPPADRPPRLVVVDPALAGMMKTRFPFSPQLVLGEEGGDWEALRARLGRHLASPPPARLRPRRRGEGIGGRPGARRYPHPG